VTQDVCDVCAVSTLDLRGALEEARRIAPDLDPAILSLVPSSIGEILQDLRRVGKAAGAGEAAETLVRDLEARIRNVTEAAEVVAFRPRVTAIDWLDPLILGGDWIPEMVRMAGGSRSRSLDEGRAGRMGGGDGLRARGDRRHALRVRSGADGGRSGSSREAAGLRESPGRALGPAR
jgi:iron complex transport system substrate-binding protein